LYTILLSAAKLAQAKQSRPFQALIVGTLGVKKAWYLGHSLGGQTVLGYALRYPEAVLVSGEFVSISSTDRCLCNYCFHIFIKYLGLLVCKSLESLERFLYVLLL
jgi:hypothetical protein